MLSSIPTGDQKHQQLQSQISSKKRFKASQPKTCIENLQTLEGFLALEAQSIDCGQLSQNTSTQDLREILAKMNALEERTLQQLAILKAPEAQLLQMRLQKAWERSSESSEIYGKCEYTVRLRQIEGLFVVGAREQRLSVKIEHTIISKSHEEKVLSYCEYHFGPFVSRDLSKLNLDWEMQQHGIEYFKAQETAQSQIFVPHINTEEIEKFQHTNQLQHLSVYQFIKFFCRSAVTFLEKKFGVYDSNKVAIGIDSDQLNQILTAHFQLMAL